MKNKPTKLKLSDLESERVFEIIENEETKTMRGGQNDTLRPSCVYHCFDRLDGNRYTWTHYSYCTQTYLGYRADSVGNIYTRDIGTIGSLGGMNVTELDPRAGLTNGQVGSGRVMALFNTPTGGHAVILVNKNFLNGRLIAEDPTNGNETIEIDSTQITTCFQVDSVGTKWYTGWVSGSGLD